ncbi:fish-egg lectin-like [Elgaria multicarinata webbii]|uniref:fish-egg lectin-like n=1 Tax=Elgaria multicarinata webbii TaxID=159646 RepID=UPI002FCCE06F
MAVKRILFLLADLVLLSAQLCTEIPNPGSLKQIDAGNGLVVGVEPTGNAFMLNGEDWLYLAGNMKHVTSGVSGVWMVDNDNNVYKMIAGNLVNVPGFFHLIDAGGDHFVAGINSENETRCLSHSELVALRPNSSVSWTYMDARLRYFSCGQKSCWGVNAVNDVVFRKGIEPLRSCKGNSWNNIPSKFYMVEVGNDGSVYGAKPDGSVYRRDGFDTNHPAGTKWTKLTDITARVSHLSYDMNILWLITKDNRILRCQL